jgi:hypothetical protein
MRRAATCDDVNDGAHVGHGWCASGRVKRKTAPRDFAPMEQLTHPADDFVGGPVGSTRCIVLM